MTILVNRDRTRKMMHRVSVREHRFAVDEPAATGGEDAGPTPHDLYDSALGACKAMTVLWYAGRKGIPIEDVQVIVDRDDAEEPVGEPRRFRAVQAAPTSPLAVRASIAGVASCDGAPIHVARSVRARSPMAS